jgi:hypothetical protein
LVSRFVHPLGRLQSTTTLGGVDPLRRVSNGAVIHEDDQGFGGRLTLPRRK